MIGMTEKLTISIVEAAEMIGISRSKAYDLVRQGKFPGAFRLGNRIIVSRNKLEEFLGVEGEIKQPAVEVSAQQPGAPVTIHLPPDKYQQFINEAKEMGVDANTLARIWILERIAHNG